MATLKLGFTGTQKGMTAKQKRFLVKHLLRWSKKYDELEIHHGDCVGADFEFHELCKEYWPHALRVVLHPPENSSKRAFCESLGQVNLDPLPYIARNHAIVDSVDGMLATPKEEKEQLRSGTWATIRYSRKTETPLILLNP